MLKTLMNTQIIRKCLTTKNSLRRCKNIHKRLPEAHPDNDLIKQPFCSAIKRRLTCTNHLTDCICPLRRMRICCSPSSRRDCQVRQWHPRERIQFLVSWPQSCAKSIWKITFELIRYETSDGQKRDETGTLKDAPPTEDNPNNKVIDIVGSYEFTSPEGTRVTKFPSLLQLFVA